MAERRARGELSDRDYQALASFRHAMRVFLQFSADAARAAGLTPNQHQLLLAIKGFAGPEGPTIGEAAESLQLKRHSTVELVDRAVEAGLVERRTDEHDRRRQHLVLTSAGAEAIASLSSVHRAELRRFRDDMAELLRTLD